MIINHSFLSLDYPASAVPAHKPQLTRSEPAKTQGYIWVLIPSVVLQIKSMLILQ